MIAGVQYIARTLSSKECNFNTGNIPPSSFSLRPHDEGHISVKEEKEGWLDYVKKDQPDKVGYAEFEIAELENLGNPFFSFLVKEVPLGNDYYHAGIFTKQNGSGAIVFKTGSPNLPKDAIELDDAPGQLVKDVLRKMATLKKL